MASREQFLTEAYSYARQAGLPDSAARVAVAQSALETGFGKSVKGNNYHGIKAGKSWKGQTQSFKTWEKVAGKRVNTTANFRAYKNPVEAFKDWAAVISRNWPSVLNAPTFKEAVSALRAGLPGGYATDDLYASKLDSISNLIDKAGVASPGIAHPTPTPSPRGIGMDQHAYAGQTRGLAPTSQSQAQTYGQYARSMQDTGLLGLDNRAGNFSAPIGKVERSPLADVAPATFSQPSRPSTPTPAGAYPSAPVDRSVTPQNPGQLGGIAMSNPVGLGGLGGLYVGQMTPLGTPVAPPAAIPSAPVQPAQVAPAPVAAPVQAPVQAPVTRQAQSFPSAPAAPSFTPGDIYGGQVGSAMSTGGNLVGRDQFGFTSVTNKHGATTVTTPGGMQAAGTTIGAAQQPGGLGGMFGGKLGGAVKSGVGAYAGSMVGGLLGPVGSVLGAVVGKELAKPGGGLIGGLINGTKTVDTAWFGPVKTSKAQGGLGFPGTPSGGYKGSASFSNRSERSMNDISPGASAAIGAGKGGLY